jgi:hypothetical protein
MTTVLPLDSGSQPAVTADEIAVATSLTEIWEA